MDTAPGTYVLVPHLSCDQQLSVARLGACRFEQGYYCYVGSARGPGGLRARLSRHLRQHKNPHWHIDYFLPHVALMEVWTASSPERLECLYAQILLDLAGAEIPVPGFGSTDCRCRTHLVYFSAPPSMGDFNERLRSCCPGVPNLTRTLPRRADG